MQLTCGYCGGSFTEDQGQPTCASCPLKGGCRFVRCPACGYENPVAPEWVARLRRWLGNEADRTAGNGSAGHDRDEREAVNVR